jgi:DNA-nicking Smr family endonuclease
LGVSLAALGSALLQVSAAGLGPPLATSQKVANGEERNFPSDLEISQAMIADPRKIILDHLARYGVRDKDAAASPGMKKKKNAVGTTKRGSMRKTLDLHGMTVGPALAALRDAIDECAHRGIAELLVVHGYGLHSAPGEAGVLKTAVLRYLEGENDPRLKSFTAAAPKDGGEGATLVRLRQGGWR